MGVYTDIEAALNTKLNTLAGHPPIAWPNMRFEPTNNETYLRPTLLPAQTELNTIAGQQLHKGIYQVDVCVPLKTGIASLTSWLDAIDSLFARGTTLTANSNSVLIQNVGMGRTERQDAWYVGYIEIYYLCYS